MKRLRLILRGLLLWYFPTDREYRIMRRWKRVLDVIAGTVWKILLGMASVREAERRLAARRRGKRSSHGALERQTNRFFPGSYT